MTLPYAAYLTIPLSFAYVDHLAPFQACVAVVVEAVAIVLGVGLTRGWSVGGVVGPVAGAAVAVVVGLSLKAMQAQAVELERLNEDLLAVQKRLAASQRQAGVLEERARLAREIHDTVAQSLSSIGLLLSALERTLPDHLAAEQIRLAHRASSEALAETRGLIAELAPPAVVDQGLPAVLERLGATSWSIGGLHVDVDCPDTSDLPMEIQTALLRLSQGPCPMWCGMRMLSTRRFGSSVTTTTSICRSPMTGSAWILTPHSARVPSDYRLFGSGSTS